MEFNVIIYLLGVDGKVKKDGGDTSECVYIYFFWYNSDFRNHVNVSYIQKRN